MLLLNQRAVEQLRVVAARNDMRAAAEALGTPWAVDCTAYAFECERALDFDGRFYTPDDGLIRTIERQDARASCRACGKRIERGERAVVFGFEPVPHAIPHRPARAFLHALECP